MRRFVSGSGTIFLLLTILVGCGSESGSPSSGLPFAEFAWERTPPDTRNERLCDEAADPDHAPDTTFLHCRVEGATFAPARAPSRDEITVLAYNLERGFQIDRQLPLIQSGSLFPVPDVLLLSEVDRGCRRTDFRDIARDYAQALGYFYVYTTEFVELPSDRGETGPYDPPLCEHGNAIVSRYPLGNVRQIRHAENRSWYTPPGFPEPDEPRLGGRIALAADMKVGERLVRLYTLHLESTLNVLRIRDAQALEIATDADDIETAVIAGGDLNAYFAVFDFQNGTTKDGPTQAFLSHGFQDAHSTLPLAERATSFDAGPLIIDFLFGRKVEVRAAGVCPRERCGDLSDHLPVWATFALPGSTADPAPVE